MTLCSAGSLYQAWTKRSISERSGVDSSCYRKLVFRASIPAPLLTLYLTPDGKHLVTGVLDLTVNPAVAQDKLRQALQQQLSSGALLTAAPGDAPLKMVVFSDYQCPHCKRFAGFLNEFGPEEREAADQLQTIAAQYPFLGPRHGGTRCLRRHPAMKAAEAAANAIMTAQNQPSTR